MSSLVGDFRNADELRKHSASLQQQIQDRKQEVARVTKEIEGYQQVVANFKSASQLSKHVTNLRALVGDFQNADALQKHVKSLDGQIREKKELLATFGDAIEDAKTAREIKSKVTYFENLVNQLEQDVDELTEAKQLQEFAFYRPRFDFDKSAEYRSKLEANRAKQKKMLKDESATKCAVEWEVSGSRAKGRQMEKQKIKLMLRAFNGECDAAIAKATYRNVESLGKRIERSFNAINKLSSVNQIEILNPYLDLKLDELHLAYEWEAKKQEEKEEQARIREQMREEEKVAKEIEKAQAQAEKEEREFYDSGKTPEEWLNAVRPMGTDAEKPYLTIAPWIVVLFEQVHRYDETNDIEKNYYVKESVGIACGLFIAAIQNMGLATLTHTPSPMGFLSKVLNRPTNERPFVLFPVGYPAPDACVPKLTRKPLDQVSTWIE